MKELKEHLIEELKNIQSKCEKLGVSNFKWILDDRAENSFKLQIKYQWHGRNLQMEFSVSCPANIRLLKKDIVVKLLELEYRESQKHLAALDASHLKMAFIKLNFADVVNI